MTAASAAALAWGTDEFEAAGPAASPDEALILDLEGYQGPLDVLLELARAQKVDLLELSVTRLADQYLAFVRAARVGRFELAADYLVMAAWLTWLKSRLLLPRDEQGVVEKAEEGARALTRRLARLAAMRWAAEALARLPILKSVVFPRGDPEALSIVPRTRLEGDLRELMDAYIGQRRREARRMYRPAPAKAYPLDDARARLRELLPTLAQWTPLTGVAPRQAGPETPSRASCIASTLSASLELVREGELEARQRAAFAELYLRARMAA
ncbi:MAG TPA: ScpA family protein [Caulobacteraceae bacterium]|nr:ScpA family protein [Caulobacteraceae bacterium]